MRHFQIIKMQRYIRSARAFSNVLSNSLLNKSGKFTFALIQINYLLLVNNHKYKISHCILSVLDKYKDKNKRSTKKNVYFRTISTHVKVILSNSSDTLVFPLQRFHCLHLLSSDCGLVELSFKIIIFT